MTLPLAANVRPATSAIASTAGRSTKLVFFLNLARALKHPTVVMSRAPLTAGTGLAESSMTLVAVGAEKKLIKMNLIVRLPSEVFIDQRGGTAYIGVSVQPTYRSPHN
jgi:hypothetical protein